MIPALLLSALVTGAPSEALAAPAVPFEGGFPVTTEDRIYELSEVKRGDRGIGYTVFAADTPEPFGVEVLGVMEGMLGPERSVILAKLTGKNIEFTGVIAGMSGSPVYIDGRLVGAVAYRFGAFTREPIAGITPIRDMLDAYGEEIEPVAAAPMFRGPLPVSLYRGRDLPALPLPLPAQRTVSGQVAPIATPLSFSGVPPEVLDAARGPLQAAGFVPVAGGGAGRLDLGAFSPRPSAARKPQENLPGEAGKVKASRIAPASAIGALLMRGDINVAAIGTVTWVDGTRVLAFGHPFIGHGKAGFPMTTAAIVNTLASEAGSYKQGLPAREVGVIYEDRLTAIGGELGEAAPMIPVRVLVQREDQPRASVGFETRVEIVDDPVWFPAMLENAIAAATTRRLGYEAGGTIDYRVRVHVGEDVLTYEDRISAPAPLRVAAFAARDVATTASILLRNELRRAPIHGVEILTRVTRAVHVLELESVRGPEQVRPGETITVQATLRPYRGPRLDVPLQLTIPADATGDVEVYVGGGVELDRKDGDARGRRTPKTLRDLVALLSDRRPAPNLYARLYTTAAGLTEDMAVLSALPPSAYATLSASPRAGLEAGTQHPGPEVSAPLDQVVSGGQSLKIRVRP